MYFHKEKVERKRHILTSSSVALFSLKSGDFAEDARLNLLVAVFRSFSSKKFPSRRMKKKTEKSEKHPLFFISPYLLPSRI